MQQFILLLHDQMQDNPFFTMSPDEIQAAIREYSAWGQRLDSKGQLVAGEKLKDEGGKQMTMENGDVSVVDGPYAEAKEVIGGFYTIRAESYEHAVELCRDHPHLRFGGRIDVREVESMMPTEKA